MDSTTTVVDLTDRLQSLRAEYANGEAEVEALERRSAELHNTMLRIAGAIQVLEELLAQAKAPPDD